MYFAAQTSFMVDHCLGADAFGSFRPADALNTSVSGRGALPTSPTTSSTPMPLVDCPATVISRSPFRISPELSAAPPSAIPETRISPSLSAASIRPSRGASNVTLTSWSSKSAPSPSVSCHCHTPRSRSVKREAKSSVCQCVCGCALSLSHV